MFGSGMVGSSRRRRRLLAAETVAVPVARGLTRVTVSVLSPDREHRRDYVILLTQVCCPGVPYPLETLRVGHDSGLAGATETGP